MMWHTHAMMGASSVWLLMPLFPADDPSMAAVLTAFAVIGALVPDLDAVESKIKHVEVWGIQPMVPVSKAINRDFGHRGLLHSLRGWMIWTLLSLPISPLTGTLSVAALSLGYASHLAGDSCTRTGIPLYYPRRRRLYALPPQCRVGTDSLFEELVFVSFALLTSALLLSHLSY